MPRAWCHSCLRTSRRCECTVWRFVAYSILTVIIINEYFVYTIYAWRWPSLHPDNSVGLRILMVADPQLLGLNDELPVLGYLTRWDSDTYLKRTFQRALQHVQPDVIVFLGDLFDEGSIANESQLNSYFHRFHDIFHTDSSVKHVYISGDNDVGGEAFDRYDERKEDRFNRMFYHSSDPHWVTNVGNVDFIKIDFHQGQRIDHAYKERVLEMASSCSGKYRFFINHNNFLNYNWNAVQYVTEKLDPHIVFTAHIHSARLRTCINCKNVGAQQAVSGRWAELRQMESPVYTFELDNPHNFHEIIVPTASYRMGVPNMGFGASYLGENGQLKYMVLWSPPRYIQIIGYIVVFFLLGCVIFIHRVYKKTCLSHRHMDHKNHY